MLRVGRLSSPEHARKLFQEYYSLRPIIEEPEYMVKREFAFQLFKGGVYVRHISFSSMDQLYDYLRREAPRNAYYSIARYSLPEASNMDEKGWEGSELLFDIDVDHMEGCSSDLVSDECLEEGYKAIKRLASVLERDLGIKKYKIYYTGHRGFHLLASCSWCLGLGRDERRLIAEYVSCEGLDVEFIIPRGRKRLKPARPSPRDPGIRGRIAGLLGNEWPEGLDGALREACINIDKQVTQDPSRLARLVGSLNGKTGFLVVDSTSGFDPRTHVESPFKGLLEVRALHDVSLYIGGRGVEVRRGEEVEVDAGIGVYLLLSGKAAVIGGEVVVRAGAGGGSL